MKHLVLALAAAVWSAGCAAQTKVPRAGPANRDVAVVVDSGSTNTEGFRVEVDRSGETRYTALRRTRDTVPEKEDGAASPSVSGALVRRLFADLEKARPLASLPERPCMKSASFGSVLTIEYRGETTPDLSCGGGTDPRARALARDAQEIAAGLRRPRRPLQ